MNDNNISYGFLSYVVLFLILGTILSDSYVLKWAYVLAGVWIILPIFWDRYMAHKRKKIDEKVIDIERKAWEARKQKGMQNGKDN